MDLERMRNTYPLISQHHWHIFLELGHLVLKPISRHTPYLLVVSLLENHLFADLHYSLSAMEFASYEMQPPIHFPSLPRLLRLARWSARQISFFFRFIRLHSYSKSLLLSHM